MGRARFGAPIRGAMLFEPHPQGRGELHRAAEPHPGLPIGQAFAALIFFASFLYQDKKDHPSGNKTPPNLIKQHKNR